MATKDELQRRVTDLEAENAALRDLVAAVTEAAALPFPKGGYWSLYEAEATERLQRIWNFLRDDDDVIEAGPTVKAKCIRNNVVKPVPYPVADVAQAAS